DFFDALKSRTRGYASLDYSEAGEQEAQLVKVDILLQGEPVDAFSAIVHKDKAYSYGVMMAGKLRELIPRQQFEVPIQAAVGSRVGRSGIDKRPIEGRASVQHLGLDGDAQLDRRDHGGEGQAVYAYGQEDAEWWERELDRALPPGRFGENLRTSGVDLTNAVLGERWRIGTALFEVTAPRIP